MAFIASAKVQCLIQTDIYVHTAHKKVVFEKYLPETACSEVVSAVTPLTPVQKPALKADWRLQIASGCLTEKETGEETRQDWDFLTLTAEDAIV